MSEEDLGSSAATEAPVSDETQNEPTQKKDVVGYETYSKVLGEAKGAKAKAKELADELESYRQKELVESGKFEELTSHLRDEIRKRDEILEGKEQAFKAKEAEYVTRWVHTAIKTQALQEGCEAPDKLLRLIDSSDLNTLRVNQDNSVNREDLQNLIAKSKQENSFLFRKATATVEDNAPKEIDPGIKFDTLTAKQQRNELLEKVRNAQK